MSYFHSVSLYFAAIILPAITWPISAFLSTFNLTLQETSFQLSPFNRVTFVTTHLFSILLLSLLMAIPLFLLLSRKLIKPSKNLSEKKKPGIIWEIRNRLQQQFRIPRLKLSDTQMKTAKSLAMIIMVISVIVVPRIVILYAQGGPYQSSNYQLSYSYGPISELLIDHDTKIHGDILTYIAPAGLQYYISEVNVVDLRFPANLAHLKECFNSTDTFQTITALKQMGFRHLLFNIRTIYDMDNALNNTLTSIINNPNFSLPSKTYGNWILYDLGPFEILKTIIPLDGWMIDTRFTSGLMSYENNETGVFLELISGDSDDKLTLSNYVMPLLNFSDRYYLLVNISGTDNAQILLRFYFNNGTNLDIIAWVSPLNLPQIILMPQFDGFLRSDIYFSLISSDSTRSSVIITELAMIREY